MLYDISTNVLTAKTGFLWLAVSMLCIVNVFGQSTRVAENKLTTDIQEIQPGRFTWVAFSSTDYQQALAKQKAFRERGYTGNILRAVVDQQTYYRIVFGQYDSRKEAHAARSKLNVFLPHDGWMLTLRSGFALVSRANWLPVTTAMALEMDRAKNERGQDENEAGSLEEKPVLESSEAQTVEKTETLEDPSGSTKEEDASTARNVPVGFMARHFEAALQLSNIYEDNIDHDEAFEAVSSYGMVPALHVRFKSSVSDPLLTLEYLVARHAYSNTERWDRVSNAFRGAIEPRISDAFYSKTSAELSLKGSSEDRDISNQFQVAQEFEYRFTRRHRLQLYGTYRIKRFPDQPGAKDFKPNVGVNFERSNSDGERFESGARYEFNKEEESRGNYKRWTFTVAYRSPEINERNQFEIDVKHRRKFYMARFVEIEDEDFLRQDNRFSIGLGWIHEFSRGVSMEVGYEFETRGSNDPERLYEANAFSLAMVYVL